jgi:hypothetical protein
VRRRQRLAALGGDQLKVRNINRKRGHCKQNEHRHGDYQNCLTTFAMSGISASVLDHDCGSNYRPHGPGKTLGIVPAARKNSVPAQKI